MASGFRFRLEVVRRLRQQALDSQRRVLADAVRSAAQVEDRLAQLRYVQRSSIHEARHVRRARRLDMVSLCAYQHHRGWINRRILEAQQELTRKEVEVKTERERLAEAMKRVKVIEKLRDKRRSRYDMVIRRREQADYDEAAIQMHRRRDMV